MVLRVEESVNTKTQQSEFLFYFWNEGASSSTLCFFANLPREDFSQTVKVFI